MHGRGIDLNYCDVEWLALETNGDLSVIFEVASKYCILDSFVDYEGYSISSMGFLPIKPGSLALQADSLPSDPPGTPFLPTVVDIMVI